MATFELNLVPVRLCFIFTLILQHKCDNDENFKNCTSYIQFMVFLLVSVFVSVFLSICVVYFLYFKRMGFKWKIWNCQMQETSSHNNQTNARIILESLSRNEITIPTNFENINVPDRSSDSVQQNESNNQAYNKELDTSHSRSDSDREILTCDARKYLEMLKNEQGHIYDVPRSLQKNVSAQAIVQSEAEYELIPDD